MNDTSREILKLISKKKLTTLEVVEKSGYGEWVVASALARLKLEGYAVATSNRRSTRIYWSATEYGKQAAETL